MENLDTSCEVEKSVELELVDEISVARVNRHRVFVKYHELIIELVMENELRVLGHSESIHNGSIFERVV